MTTKLIHREAMKFAQNALVARQNANEPLAVSLYEKAFELEKEAALTLIVAFEKEPTRSVLFRSAASLAFECKKFKEAEKMVFQGLAGNPPDEIADELRSLFDDIVSARRLEINRMKIRTSELQFSLVEKQIA